MWSESVGREEERGFVLDAYRGTELGKWGQNIQAVSLYAIKDTRYGLAACNETKRSHFNYQLLYRGKPIRLEALVVAWDMAQGSLIRDFNALCVGCSTDQDKSVIVLLDINGLVDFGGMENCLANPGILPSMPADMRRLAYTIGWLTT